MEKKYEDDELDKLIEEQFIKEAQIMEEALFSDEDFEDYDASDEEIKASYQQLVDRMEADGVFMDHTKKSAGPEDRDSNLSNATSIPLAAGAEDTVHVSNGVGKVIPMPKKKKSGISYKFAKVAGFVFVSGMCVFAASMTSEANRDYVVKHARYLVGDDTRLVSDNDEKNDGDTGNEYEAIKDIENKLGIEIPEFLYRPVKFDYYKYEVDTYAQFAKIEYQYNDSTIIEFGIDKESEIRASTLDSLHGDKLEIVNIQEGNIEVNIDKVQDAQDEQPAYFAQWEKESVIYYFFGKMDLDELLKMIQRIRY